MAGVCWQHAARYFSLPSFHASQVLPESFWTRGNVRNNLATMAARSAKPKRISAQVPGVYPYSVIPGGVSDANDLRHAVLRDYVVRRHYGHFDYDHAQLIRVTHAREVYVSYRVRDRIFWTRKKIRLHAGELLLTDGKITARARCGNQISDAVKPEVSDEEPEDAVLDQPVAPAPAARSLPFHPALAAPDLPGGEVRPPQLFAGGFSFPYVPFGLPVVSGSCSANDKLVDGHCRPKHHPPVVPEPSTLVLTATGLAIIVWRFRGAVVKPSSQLL